jgi:hypothetical protein
MRLRTVARAAVLVALPCILLGIDDYGVSAATREASSRLRSGVYGRRSQSATAAAARYPDFRAAIVYRTSTDPVGLIVSKVLVRPIAGGRIPAETVSDLCKSCSSTAPSRAHYSVHNRTVSVRLTPPIFMSSGSVLLVYDDGFGKNGHCRKYVVHLDPTRLVDIAHGIYGTTAHPLQYFDCPTRALAQP